MPAPCLAGPEKILFIGDSVLDRYSWDGQVHLRAGCVANLLRAASFDGNAIDLVSTFPDPELLARLLPSGNSTPGVTLFPSHGPLNFVDYAVADDGVLQVKDDPAPCPHLFDEEMAALILMGEHSVIAVADYGLGTLGPCAKAAIRARGASGRAEVLVDARHANYDDYRGASWFLPTLDEFLQYRPSETGDGRSPAWFVKELGASGVVLKKGAGGLQVITSDGRDFELAGLPEHLVVDAFGAGDMLLGGLATRIRREGFDQNCFRRVLDIVFGLLQLPAAGDLARAARTSPRGAASASVV